MYKLASFLVFIAALPAHATSCIGPITVCSSFEGNAIVFRGRALQAIPHPSPVHTFTSPDGSTGQVIQVPMAEDFRFQILEVFKGNPGSEVTLTGGNGEFHEGEEYVVFASPNPATHTLQTSVCSGNRAPAGLAWDADLAWLRAYPTAPPTISIFGNVSMGYGVTDIPTISIDLTGPENLTATSGDDHSYSFKSLPPGSYTVTAVLPVGYTTSTASTASVTVAAKGCAEVDWYIRSDTHITGTVTDTAGKLAPNIPVGLLRPAQNRTGSDVVASASTDANGNYDFAKVQPGGYWVALYYLGPNNREPHAPVFYPSGSSSSSAELIHLGPAETRHGVDLVLTPDLSPVAIHIHVVNPDGTPVIHAHVDAIDPLTPSQFTGAIADADGNATVTLYDGRQYSLTASTSGTREPACAGPINFVVKPETQLGTLTLDKTVGQCRALQKPK